MFRSLFILYLLIFGTYILFTRIPDYFDGEKYPATIQMVKDSASKLLVPTAVYSVGGKQYSVSAKYLFTNYKDKEAVEIIVEKEHIEKGVVYRFWGYWITWGELVSSIIMSIVLFQVAISITNNPTEKALAEQVGYKEEKKTKYSQ